MILNIMELGMMDLLVRSLFSLLNIPQSACQLGQDPDFIDLSNISAGIEIIFLVS